MSESSPSAVPSVPPDLPALLEPRGGLGAPGGSGGGRAAFVLGTMNFGKRTPEAEAKRIIDRARGAGCGLFDTANVYVDGESERVLGRALGQARKDVLVATKVGLGGMNQGRKEGLRPDVIAKACDESLARLGTDVIDLYYLHAPDHDVPLAESLGAVGRLVEAGKVRFLGMSNYASWQILEAIALSERQGTPRPVVAQQMYNLLVRQLDVEYFAFARSYPIHTTVYNPLAGGVLAGSLGPRFEKNKMYQRRYAGDRMQEAAAAYARIAEKHQLSRVELAYAWLVEARGVDSVLVGPGTVSHLEDALGAWTKSVPKEALRDIDALHVELTGTDARYAR